MQLKKWFSNLREHFYHLHDMKKVAHWCDKNCSVIIVEYKCCSCGHTAWDFVYFDDERCKVLKRIPVEVNPFDATKLAECGELTCEISTQDKPQKRKPKAKADTKKSDKKNC